MDNEQFEIMQGCSDSFHLDLFDGDDQPVTTYTGDEEITVQVWPGDGGPVLVQPAAAWEDAVHGILSILVSSEDTSALDPGTYYQSVQIDQGSGNKVEVYRGWLTITAAPGSDTEELKVYNTYKDMLKFCPRLGKDQVEGQQAGFVEQCALAREWFEAELLTRDATNNRWNLNYDVLRGYRPSGAYNETVKGWLAADKLLVTPKVKEICARKAVSLVYETAFNISDEGEDKFLKYSRTEERIARSRLQTLVAELDTDDDGKPDYWIDCGKIVSRGYN